MYKLILMSENDDEKLILYALSPGLATNRTGR
jgi:hypothetical protein